LPCHAIAFSFQNQERLSVVVGEYRLYVALFLLPILVQVFGPAFLATLDRAASNVLATLDSGLACIDATLHSWALLPWWSRQ